MLNCELNALRHKLKEWKKGESGNVGLQRKKLLEKMAEIDTERKKQSSHRRRNNKKSCSLTRVRGTDQERENIRRQRSRVLWLKEGDKNTKFFDKMANLHKRYSNIDQLMIHGEVTQQPNRIEWDYNKHILPEAVYRIHPMETYSPEYTLSRYNQRGEDVPPRQI